MDKLNENSTVRNNKIIQFALYRGLRKWGNDGVRSISNGVQYPEKPYRIRILEMKKDATCNAYYVYQSTPYDLYGTPDFKEL